MSISILDDNVNCPICKNNSSNIYSIGYDYEYQSCKNQFSFNYCEQCDIIFLNPRPYLSELSTIYPSNYEPYNFTDKNISYIVRNFIETRKAIKLTKNLSINAKIIDVGSGGTIFLDRLKKLKIKSLNYGEMISMSRPVMLSRILVIKSPEVDLKILT
jgi:hypothetical protein